MVRQYIGARYVTKIYENSLDPSSAEWESGVNYEPLTLVTYNNGSYLSKKEVPANIGDPASNGSYWVQTGFYNGQIASLQQQISDIYSETVVGNLVTPEMYGAVGDGVTDDSAAIEEASTHGIVFGGDHTYYVANSIQVQNGIIGGKYIIKDPAGITITKNNCSIENAEFTNRVLPSDRGQWLLILRSVKNVNVHDCHFHNACNALYVDNSEQINIYCNTFEDLPQIDTNGYGVLTVNCSNIFIENNIFYNVARHSIYLSHETDNSSYYNINIFIKNNLFMWDSNASGNTTGLETTIFIRPSKNVYIDGNVFQNMFDICTINRQQITIGGVLTEATSENIHICNNNAVLNNPYRTEGVLFISIDNINDALVAPKDLYIENNIIEMTRLSVVRAGAYENLYITGNKIKSKTTGDYAGFVYTENDAGSKETMKNLYIINNDFEAPVGGCPVFYMYYAFDSGDRGDFIIERNRFKNLSYFGSVPQICSFNKFYLIDNDVDYDASATRNYFSTSTAVYFKAKGNVVNKRLSLYLDLPTNILFTDPNISGYGEYGVTLTGAMNGAMMFQGADTSLKINTPTGWATITP